MKWEKRGHEFDEIGAIFEKNRYLFIIGTEKENNHLKKRLAFLGTTISAYSFFPNITEEKGLKKLLVKIISFAFQYIIPKHVNQIVLVSESRAAWIGRFCKYGGYKNNETIFPAEEFMKKYLPIFAVYAYGKVYSYNGTCIVVTTHCSLNCKYCLNYQPYIKDKKHMELEQIKKDIDIFFSCFDRVEFFSLTGGEPFLHKGLIELIEYVYDNYKDKYEIFGTATNGTIVPSDELCKVLKDCNIELLCDDYTKSFPDSKTSYGELIKKCEEFGINYLTGKDIKFFITFPPHEDYTKYGEDVLIDRYGMCKGCYSGYGLRNGRLYSCCYSMFADTARIVDAIETDYYDLSKFSPTDQARKELVEFRLDYSPKGYVRFCKYCNGFPSINKAFDENGATQQPRTELLHWDI